MARGQRRDVSERARRGRCALGHHLPTAAHVGHHAGHPHRRRLHGRARESPRGARAARTRPWPRTSPACPGGRPRTRRRPAAPAVASHVGGQAIGLVGVGAPDEEEAVSGSSVDARCGPRLQELGYALLRHQAADESDDRRVLGDARATARVGRRRRGGPRATGSNRSRSMPFPSRRIRLAGCDALAERRVHVLVVLRQDQVRAPRRDLLEGHVEATDQGSHAVVEIEAVEGVHDHGDPGEARRDLGQEARAWGCGCARS